MARYSVSAVPRPASVDEPESLQFPGCRPVRISRDAMADYEGRIEYWDATTEVAMVCEPVSVYHEHPPQRLAGLLKTISHERGSPIETFGVWRISRSGRAAPRRTRNAVRPDAGTADGLSGAVPRALEAHG